MVDLTFRDIAKRIAAFNLPDFDLVIGISDGGLIPAGMIAYKLSTELKVLKISFRDKTNTPIYDQPKIVTRLNEIQNSKLLIVDDVSVTGKTIEKAKEALAGNEVKTLTLIGKADYVLFPEIKDCVNWPWKVYSNDEEQVV